MGFGNAYELYYPKTGQKHSKSSVTSTMLSKVILRLWRLEVKSTLLPCGLNAIYATSKNNKNNRDSDTSTFVSCQRLSRSRISACHKDHEKLQDQI